MGQVVGLSQLSPPMSPHSIVRAAAEGTSGVVGPGVHSPDRHPRPDMLDRQSKVAVIRDHHSCLDLLLAHISQKMGGNVDVRTLLFPVCDRHHEDRIGVIKHGSGLTFTGHPGWTSFGRSLRSGTARGRVLTLLV
jgi:hypothetical protein